MIYFTIKQPVRYKQISLEDLLSGKEIKPIIMNKNQTNTRTYELRQPMNKMYDLFNFEELFSKIEVFNNKYEE